MMNLQLLLEQLEDFINVNLSEKMLILNLIKFPKNMNTYIVILKALKILFFQKNSKSKMLLKENYKEKSLKYHFI